jgi:zinc/manganese transport system substrate-binding protein
MNKLSCLIIAIVVITFSHTAMARINVFACEPEWGSLAKELGGDDMKIYTATTAFQDPHRIEARPSLIAKMRRADLLICSGADLEIGWLPLLLRSSANKKVQVGQPGYFEAAMQVERLEVLEKADRSMGDVHIQGNPHVHLDPRRMATIAAALTQRLMEIDPDNNARYQQRGNDFQSRWHAAMEQWSAKAAPLKGERIVVHHKDWVYLFDWLGIEEAGTLESKPGVPPSASYLAKVLTALESKPAKKIIYTSYQSPKPARWLSERAKIPAVQLPFTIGGSDKAKDLFSLMDETIGLLLKGEN